MISETICTVTSENSKTSLSDNRRLKTSLSLCPSPRKDEQEFKLRRSECDTVEFFQRGS